MVIDVPRGTSSWRASPKGRPSPAPPRCRWPAVVMRNVWVLPGIPEAFQMKLAIVRESLAGGAPFVSRAVFTKMDEGELKPLLDAVVEAHPEVEVGLVPQMGRPHLPNQVDLRRIGPARSRPRRPRFLALLPAGEPQRVE